VNWIKAAKDVSSSNPNNKAKAYLEAFQPMALLEADPVMPGQHEAVTAMVDSNAKLLQDVSLLTKKVTNLLKGLKISDFKEGSKSPLYDAIMALDAQKASLLEITAVAGSEAGYVLKFGFHAVTNHQVDQLQHAYHDAKHINKKGPPA
jgi:hypothetical protein